MDQLDLLQVYFNLCETLFLKGPDSRYFRLTGHVVSAGALSCAVLYQKRPQKICTHVDEQHAAFRRSFVYRSEWPAARLLLVPGQASCALGSARCDPSERSFACPWSEMRPLHSVSWALWGSCSSQLPGPLARVRTAENSENIPSQASGACSLQRPPAAPGPRIPERCVLRSSRHPCLPPLGPECAERLQAARPGLAGVASSVCPPRGRGPVPPSVQRQEAAVARAPSSLLAALSGRAARLAPLLWRGRK